MVVCLPLSQALCAVPFNLHIRIVREVLYVFHFIGEGILRKVKWLSQSHTASKWPDESLRLSFLVTKTHAVLKHRQITPGNGKGYRMQVPWLTLELLSEIVPALSLHLHGLGV